jgi:ATP-dependent DNA helicase RecQ
MNQLIQTHKIKSTSPQTPNFDNVEQLEKIDQIIKVFGEYFPNKTIKPLQYQIIKSIIDKQDTMGILPTGFGKSVCYQVPYLLNPNKVVIVVSPLISLMEDQKDKLEKMNIPVACFHSNINQKKKQEVKNKIFQNLLTDNLTNSGGMVLFLTPEYIINCQTWIEQLASNNKLALVAMDEAHCISTWGHDFRPDYQDLYKIKEWISSYKIPLLCLTATATKQVEEDIKTFLQLDNPKVFKTSFDRPNLIISVRSKPKSHSCLIPILNNYKEDFSIIYCKTRDKAESICEFLKLNDFNAGVYHAGFCAETRQDIQDKFANKELNIIVATVAFGMGIDQNVHLVVHWGCPADMESYYQEIGRAGRDNIESECVLFYDKDDFRISRYFLKSITNEAYRKFKDEQISKMERFCMLAQCRRKIILTHFGEILASNYMCSKCDNCAKQENISQIATNNLMYPIFIISQTIFLVKCKLGTNKICLILKGSKSKTIMDFIKIKTYGLLKNLSEEQIKSIISIMTINGYIREKSVSSGFGTILETTSKLVTFYTKILRESNNCEPTYDNLQPILNHQSNILELNIPIEYNHVANIKFKSTIDSLIDEFGNDLNN